MAARSMGRRAQIIASSIIVHEWYSHVMKGFNDTDRNHNLAYKNVIGYNNFWEKPRLNISNLTG